ncbi:unnamed protein product [Discosporangium mesarthrocarpum]
MVAILFGLGATLVLLSVHRVALPALPISIGLGVAVYFFTRLSLQPYIEAITSSLMYL